MKNQHLYLGITNPKSPSNMGSILRAAGCFGAKAVYYTGQRYNYAKKFATDTKEAGAQIPQLHCDEFDEINIPNLQIVGVELVEGATPLPNFEHPESALYLFGPEDGSLSQKVVDSCDHIVYLPTKGCLNLAATVNIVLYDRAAKSPETVYGDELIQLSRDTNNKTKWSSKQT